MRSGNPVLSDSTFLDLGSGAVLSRPADAMTLNGTITKTGILLFLGLFQIALPYSLISRAMGKVTALDASLIFLIEPALSPIVAWAVHGEIPGPWPIFGAAVILVTTVLRVVGDMRHMPTLDPPAAAA